MNVEQTLEVSHAANLSSERARLGCSATGPAPIRQRDGVMNHAPTKQKRPLTLRSAGFL